MGPLSLCMSYRMGKVYRKRPTNPPTGRRLVRNHTVAVPVAQRLEVHAWINRSGLSDCMVQQSIKDSRWCERGIWTSWCEWQILHERLLFLSLLLGLFYSFVMISKAKISTHVTTHSRAGSLGALTFTLLNYFHNWKLQAMKNVTMSNALESFSLWNGHRLSLSKKEEVHMAYSITEFWEPHNLFG